MGPPRRALDFALLVSLCAALGFTGDRLARLSRAATFVMRAGDADGRMRVAGKPGDLGIRNRAATAIVRREDGALVDFWPTPPRLPSTAQLGDTRNLDGLWYWSIGLVHGGREYAAFAPDAEVDSDSIRTHASIQIGPSTFVVDTRYRFASDDEPRLHVETTITHEKGSYRTSVLLADTIKWGNVTYFGGGVGPLPLPYEGEVDWIGRKGASGDLILEDGDQKKLHVAAKGYNPGFWPPAFVTRSSGDLDPGQSVTIARVLRYARIPGVERPTKNGTLEVTVVDELGRPLPAKLSFHGLEGTPDPDFGDQGDESGAGRFVWSGTGQFHRALVPGKYAVMATSGPERDAQRWNVQVREGKTTTERGTLPRVVPTPGWISADLHLHQVASIDADIAFDTRVIAIAAEGVELAIATDHYEITDLGPTVRALRRSGRLATPMATMPGSEVSTTGERFGHFNAFPVPLGAKIPYHHTTPDEVFGSVRRDIPNALIQVNHPRWDGLGYFRVLQMNPDNAAVPESHAHLWSPNFDAIEIYNGVDVPSEAAVLAPMFDWLNLLASGHRYTATGNSDSHNLFFLDPGLPRNLIRWSTSATDEDDRSAPEGSILAGLKTGSVVVTSGPMLDVGVGSAGPGETAEAAAGRVSYRVRVSAAPWVDVSRLRIYVGASRAPRIERAIQLSTAITRLDETFPLVVPDGSFIVALATGDRPLENVWSKNARPLAVSNPVWVRHRR